jgi:4-hydroxy-tetrahydrodipicolinate synthase
MRAFRLSGVIAAVATAVDKRGEPDGPRSTALARVLLDQGCDGLNVLGTTGEATSFSLNQRRRLMTAYHEAGLPTARLMVGTGAAAVADAVELTRHAAELGFAGALVLPPFYYKNVGDDGLLGYLDAILSATAQSAIALYLYHFPALSGCPWHLGLIARIRAAFGDRVAGLKDSSGELGLARAAAALSPSFAVFPSNEATLEHGARDGFAGCISATINLNADLCARAYREADRSALAQAVAIRRLFEHTPLIASVKALLAHIHDDPAWARVLPPLCELGAEERAQAILGYEAVRGGSVAAATAPRR